MLVYIRLLVFLFFFGSTLYMYWFFRDPKRIINGNPLHVLAAADGTILYMYSESDILEIAIRMSPFNVHLNRIPISATLQSIDHRPGEHKSVYFAGAEEKNERNLLLFENEDMICEILQLTGAFARRLEVWSNIGDSLQQGEKFGMIRFGSQTNVRIKMKAKEKSLLPSVNVGDKVEAGVTVIAEIRVNTK